MGPGIKPLPGEDYDIDVGLFSPFKECLFAYSSQKVGLRGIEIWKSYR